MSKNRIEEKLAQLKEQNEKAFITYLTAGLPDMEQTKAIIRAQEAAGTDIVEIGVPFSDPIADGPVIQQASYESILGGTNIRKCFTAVEQLRADGCELPFVFMLYYNTICHYGVQAFVEKCRTVGVDGLIIPDLPLEEQEEIKSYLDGQDETILIQLVSPVSAGRIPQILDGARGFVSGFWQMLVILSIMNLIDRFLIDDFWVGHTKAWTIPGTEDLKPYITKKDKCKKWIFGTVGMAVISAILSGIMMIFVH